MVTYNRKILLLEDDNLFAESLIDLLEINKYDIDHAKDGEEALNYSFDNTYDLFLFDINVPKINGIELLKDLRISKDYTPTIFLTSYKDDETINESFLSGCDDYIKKPFNVNELLLRVNAVLKRTAKVNDTKIFLTKNIYFDFEKRIVFEKDLEVIMPFKVICLLELFIQKDNSIVTNEEIISKLWSVSEEYSSGSLRLYINRLRNLLGKEKIINIKKVGYKIEGIILEQ